MKNIFKFIFIITVFIFAQNTFAEEIQNYDVDINLHKDSSMTVTETIDYDFGDLQKHGVFRFIPLTFEVEGQKKMYGLQQRTLKIENLSVQRDGAPESYSKKEKDDNGNYFIKIGKANETITGLHRYKITYDVLGSLRYFDTYDEIYWNTIGLDWKVPIRQATVRLHSDGIPFKNISCYVGKLKDAKKCLIENDNNEVIFSQSELGDHEGMTVAASFDKGLVPQVEFYVFTPKAFALALLLFLVILFGGVWYWVRKYQRKYFSYDPIHPRYTPPEDFDAIETGYLIDRKLDPRDISAGIIQLARDGYITIEKIENKAFIGSVIDYRFTLKKNVENSDSKFSKIRKHLLRLLFVDDKYPIEDSIIEDTSFLRNKSVNLNIESSSLMSEIAKKNNKLQSVLIEEEIEAFNTDKIEKNKTVEVIILLYKILNAVLIVYLFAGIENTPIYLKVLIVLLFIFSFFSNKLSLSRRYTKKGWETKHAIEGFKLFLSMTEKERYEFFNNPADNPQEFMEYLPYAIALGVEKKWAKQFESITIPQPEWYHGGSGPFVATAFADEMSSFSQSVTSSVATKASSGSGSGGGGFSGGGSGGGGGGSW